MRGMILAAGRGTRMGPLTVFTPKPLLRVKDHYLIEYSIQAFVTAGIKEIILNVSYLGDQIKKILGNGSRYGVTFAYSEEPEALETGGGILQALPLLGDTPFVVISCDIICDFPLQTLALQPSSLAHLVLVNNPVYHPYGDFGLVENQVRLNAQPRFTFGNIGLYHPDLFANYSPGRFRLGDVLKNALPQKSVTGELFQGRWHNVGCPEDLDNFK